MLICDDLRPAKDHDNSFEIYNLGLEEYIEVSKSAQLIVNELGLEPDFIFGHGKRGWVGDNPFVFLDISKIKRLGWKPSNTIKESIKETTNWLIQNEWIFDERI